MLFGVRPRWGRMFIAEIGLINIRLRRSRTEMA